MDAMKLQKINALASELRKHNFAVSSEDAFKQAEQVYEGNEQAQVMVVEQRTPFMQQPQAQQPADEMTSRKIELLIETHSKKYDEEFGVLRSAINQLIGELNSIKSHLAKGTQAVSASSDEKSAHKEKQAELKTETKEEHPRQGKFQPADVDIQKMFYFGAKR